MSNHQSSERCSVTNPTVHRSLFTVHSAVLLALLGAFAPQAEAVSATGGIVTNYTDARGKNWTAHIFTNSGTLTVTGDGDVEYLIIAGGGGGAAGNGGAGGGGGDWDTTGGGSATAGGGNGGAWDISGANATAGTGGGGGGCGNSGVGGDGGSGIVIVRYRLAKGTVITIR